MLKSSHLDLTGQFVSTNEAVLSALLIFDGKNLINLDRISSNHFWLKQCSLFLGSNMKKRWLRYHYQTAL
jgi:hypothetical protein